jgi:ribonuclease VapC
MFVDASAIVAILAGEEDADDLALRLTRGAQRSTSPITVFEAALGLARIKGRTVGWALQTIEAFLAATETAVESIGAAEAVAAVEAFERFGKGRHPARLNMGDCFAYACARTRNLPMLYKGGDFSSTDIAPA